MKQREKRHNLRILLTVIVVLTGCPLIVQAQPFTSGSTGADGALTVTTPGTYDFYPGNTAIFPSAVDPEGDNIYNFTTITIGSGVILRLSGRYLNGPVFWLASGVVDISGTINLDGEDGNDGALTSVPKNIFPSYPGAGGYGGGLGGNTKFPAQNGGGPGGGVSGACCADRNGKGGSFTGSNVYLVPLIGGSGGGGGPVDSDEKIGGGGGAGGGALLLASSVSLAVNGSITANGGVGGQNTNGSSTGGSGSGGGIRLVAPIISGGGRIIAAGGKGREWAGTDGFIRLEAFQNKFTGPTTPAYVVASPFGLYLPPTAVATPSSIRVKTVDGVPVSSNATGSFEVPDVTINQASAMTIGVEAHNIPPGTKAQLYIFSENGPQQVLDSTPLAGSIATSTATASVTLPPGFSRGYVRATWTNQ